MADSKKYNGSTWQHSLRKLTTATDTFTTLPADIYADGNNATVGLKGNTAQSGTPTPDNPVMPQGTGNITENLLPLSDKTFTITAYGSNFTVTCSGGNLYFSGNITEIPSNYTAWKTNFAFELEAGTYYCNAPSPLGSNFGRYIKKYDDDSNIINSNTYIFTLTEKTKCYLAFYIYQKSVDSKIELMLNTGSTALPYEPFGVKIPISSANITTPVYLGEVETTRKVKKLVLTGEEQWEMHPSVMSLFRSVYINDYLFSELNIIICTHYRSIVNTGAAGVSNGETCFYYNTASTARIIYIKDETFTSAADFKSYLAAQYAAGTPVTVWYVLATEETGIVNEPLMKIGDYADTVSGITIPTITGKDTFNVETTLKPSEVSLSYTGWHDATVKECDGSQWTK